MNWTREPSPCSQENYSEKKSSGNESLEALSKLLSGYSERFKKRILGIEKKYTIIEKATDSTVHTLPYYLTNGTILFEQEQYNRHILLQLMDKYNSIALCDAYTGNSIVERNIYTGDIEGLRNLLGNSDGKFYLHGREYINLEEDPSVLSVHRVKNNQEIGILEALRNKEKTEGKGKTDASISSDNKTKSKRDLYFEIRKLLNEYKQIVKYGDVTQGKRLLECLKGILENLMFFPEYINEKSINTIFKGIKISEEDFNEYIRLLNLYNSINDELEKSNSESDSDTVKTELDRKIEQITGNKVSSDINKRTQEENTKKIAKKIKCLSQMANLIFPIMQDPEINSIINTLSQFFDRDLTPKELSYDEINRIKDKIIRFEKGNNDVGLERVYLTYDIDLISEGKIGETEYILIRDCYKESRRTEIHTMNGIYEIDVSDDRCIEYRHLFSRDGKKYRLEVFMPIKSNEFEKVCFVKPNKEDETYMENDRNDYSVHKISGCSKTFFYYKSKEDVLNAKPSRSERIQEASFENLLGLLPSKKIEPELDTITCSAIKHSIKGVMPKEILELYRTVNPKIATLIENYGVKVQESNTNSLRRKTPETHDELE